MRISIMKHKRKPPATSGKKPYIGNRRAAVLADMRRYAIVARRPLETLRTRGT